VKVVPPPPAFVAAQELLRRSLVLSIEDDVAIREWIYALAAGDEQAADQYWRQQLRLSAEARAAPVPTADDFSAGGAAPSHEASAAGCGASSQAARSGPATRELTANAMP
jgi:hypothetical protein